MPRRASWPPAQFADPPQIVTSFADHGLQRGQLARTPGGYLSQLLEEAAEPDKVVRCPPKSTIHENLKKLRAGITSEEPSG
jgi:hypothetical protein